MIEDVKKNSIYTIHFWGIFLVLSILYILLSYLTNTFIYTIDFYQTLLHGSIDEQRINQTIELRQHFLWLSYLIQPLLLLLRCAIFSGAIYAGSAIFNAEIEYKNCLRIVILAEIVTFISLSIKMVYFFIIPDMSPKTYQYFYPLCITQLLNLDSIPRYFIYPLSQFNVFEGIYWVVLASGVKFFSHRSVWHALKVVVSSYGALLVTWILITLLITLQLN